VVEGLPAVGNSRAATGARRQAPGAAALEHDVEEDGVENLAQAVERGTPVGFGRGKVELQAAPFGVG
jgi:hypothetical protein